MMNSLEYLRTLGGLISDKDGLNTAWEQKYGLCEEGEEKKEHKKTNEYKEEIEAKKKRREAKKRRREAEKRRREAEKRREDEERREDEMRREADKRSREQREAKDIGDSDRENVGKLFNMNEIRLFVLLEIWEIPHAQKNIFFKRDLKAMHYSYSKLSDESNRRLYCEIAYSAVSVLSKGGEYICKQEERADRVQFDHKDRGLLENIIHILPLRLLSFVFNLSEEAMDQYLHRERLIERKVPDTKNLKILSERFHTRGARARRKLPKEIESIFGRGREEIANLHHRGALLCVLVTCSPSFPRSEYVWNRRKTCRLAHPSEEACHV